MKIDWKNIGDGLSAIANAKMSDDAAQILNRKQQTTMQDTSSQANDPNYTYDSDTGQYVPSLAAITAGTDQGLQAATPTFKSQSTFNGKTSDTPFSPEEVRSQNIKDATDFWQTKGAFGTDMVKNLQASQLNDAKLAESKLGQDKGKLELKKLGFDVDTLEQQQQLGKDYRSWVDAAHAIDSNPEYSTDLAGKARAYAQAYSMIPNGGQGGVSADGSTMWHVDKNGQPITMPVNAQTLSQVHDEFLSEAQRHYMETLASTDPNLAYKNQAASQKDREIGIQQQNANTQEKYRVDQAKLNTAHAALLDEQRRTGNWGMTDYHHQATAALGLKGGANSAVGITDDGSLIVPGKGGGFVTQPLIVDGKKATPEQIKLFKAVHAANGETTLTPKDRATIMKDVYAAVPDFDKLSQADQALKMEQFGIKGAGAASPFKIRGAAGAQGGDPATPVKSSGGLQSSLRTMFAPSGATSAAYSMGDQYVRDPVSGQMITADEYTRKFGEAPTN